MNLHEASAMITGLLAGQLVKERGLKPPPEATEACAIALGSMIAFAVMGSGTPIKKFLDMVEAEAIAELAKMKSTSKPTQKD